MFSQVSAGFSLLERLGITVPPWGCVLLALCSCQTQLLEKNLAFLLPKSLGITQLLFLNHPFPRVSAGTELPNFSLWEGL